MKTTNLEIEKTLEEETERARTAELAYQFWEERGCPIGSPEEDWYRAEQEMRAQRPVRSAERPVRAAA